MWVKVYWHSGKFINEFYETHLVGFFSFQTKKYFQNIFDRNWKNFGQKFQKKNFFDKKYFNIPNF